MRRDDEYEVVWSGTLEREGKCGGLSAYEGGSNLDVAPGTFGPTHCVDCGDRLTRRSGGRQRCEPCGRMHRRVQSAMSMARLRAQKQECRTEHPWWYCVSR